MATAALKDSARAARSEAEFRSSEEFRDVLDALLNEVDEDPDFGPRMRAANLPHRAVYPDLDVVLNIAAAPDRGEHCLRWSFSEEDDWDPTLTMVMDSGVANRFLQGRMNFAIAVARGEIRVSSAEPGAAMDFLPLSVGLIARYRAVLKASFPHLLID
jgi:hypothetical protein